MAQWINDPQNREEIEKVTNEIKLPIYKASAKGKFRAWLSETWGKLEDYILKLKSIVDNKEEYISKKSGFNLDKTDDFNDNDTNKLATSKAVNGVYKSSVQRNGGQDFWLHKSLDGHIYVYFQKNNAFNLKLADSDEVNSKKITVNGNNVWHTGNFDPNNKVNKFGGTNFKGLHLNTQGDLYYFIDDKTGRKLIDSKGGDVDNLTIGGAKIYHTENLIRRVWSGAYLANLNETNSFCILPPDWRVCIIGYQWVSGAGVGLTFGTAVILKNHVSLNRWFLAHSGNPNNQVNLMWGEARFMITGNNGLISQGQNTYGGDCYVLTVDVI